MQLGRNGPNSWNLSLYHPLTNNYDYLSLLKESLSQQLEHPSPMTSTSSNSRLSAAMDRTSQWVFSQEIPTDVVVQVGDANFPLHKFLLVAKSGYMRRRITESDRPDLATVDLSGVPGGAEAFEKAAKFCYGVNFEISVHNVAALRCAAEYLEMTDDYSPGNLAGRTEDFLARAALKSFSGALLVLKSCEALLPLADELRIVQRCVDAVALKACVESNFPTRSPPEWWAGELAAVIPAHFQKILASMKSRSATPKTLSTAVVAYAEKSLPDLISTTSTASTRPSPADARAILESLVASIPSDRDAPLSAAFLCCLLRAAIHLDCSAACRRELERRAAAVLDQATARDLLTVALGYGGERIVDLDSVRRIVAGFAERELGGGTAMYGAAASAPAASCCSAAVQKVARTVDAFVAEIATDEELAVSKFAGVACALPKVARRFDDDIYRAVDIYLKVHPALDEIEREKVCSVMDPLKLSYEARLHASQNKRLPLQVVLHVLYYDQLKVRSGAVEEPKGTAARGRAVADASLMKENEELRSELTKMKMFMTDMHRSQGSKGPKKPTFMSSVSRTLGKLNPFVRSKDTFSIHEDTPSEAAKPRRRRFSMS